MDYAPRTMLIRSNAFLGDRIPKKFINKQIKRSIATCKNLVIQRMTLARRHRRRNDEFFFLGEV